MAEWRECYGAGPVEHGKDSSGLPYSRRMCPLPPRGGNRFAHHEDCVICDRPALVAAVRAVDGVMQAQAKARRMPAGPERDAALEDVGRLEARADGAQQAALAAIEEAKRG